MDAHAGRLDAAKLAIAREEISSMERLCIVHRYNSPWASPLHMVAKADGKWRACGDFQQLNNISVHDRYPVPHIQDFSVYLDGATIFSKVDLVHGFRCLKLRLSPYLDYLNSCGCLLVSRGQHRHSSC